MRCRSTVWMIGICMLLATAAQAEEEVEVLPRRPIHEAFVETITNDPQPGMIVEREPPDPVKVPPDVRPDGERMRVTEGRCRRTQAG